MWKERPGTWTSALAAPAGRDESCATPRCVLQLSARHRSETRILAATFVQVITKKGFEISILEMNF